MHPKQQWINNGCKCGYHGLSGRRTDMSRLFTSESMVRETSDSPFFPGVPPSEISPWVSDLNLEE